MSITVNKWVLPATITLFCASLVMYKLSGGALNLATFISGALFGMAVVGFGLYALVASRAGVTPW
jgi:multisubunit Na+/H+ antiporter MnhE subunit